MSEQSGHDRVRQAYQTLLRVIGRCEEDDFEGREQRLKERLDRLEKLAAASPAADTPPKPPAEA